MRNAGSVLLDAARARSRGTWTSLLPAVYPLSLILGLIAIPAGAVLLRLGLVVAAAPGWLRLGEMTRSHSRFFAVLGAYLATVTLSSLVSVNSSLALADLQRQVFLAAVAMSLSLALADYRARAAFALGAVAVSVTSSVIILSLYGRFAGIPLLGPVQESFKGYAAYEFDFPLNAVSFAAVLAAAIALPYLTRRPPALVIVLLSVGVAVAASGSRTTALSLLVAIPLTVGLLLLGKRRRVPMWIPYGSLAAIAGWAGLTFADRLGRHDWLPSLNELTTGRSLLWSAAWEKFLQRPLFGWGGQSFPIELGRFLPGGEVYQAEDLRILSTTGGAHNALLTVLAERGIIAGLAAVLMSIFLLLLAIRVFHSRKRLHGIDRASARLAPFVIVLILLRSLGELPGWFGYADSLVDFLAYGYAAMLVAVAASMDRVGEPSGEPRQAQLVRT